jgi:hypothetical protein
MPDLAYPPCLRPGCKSPTGHPNCRCFSDVSTSQLEASGYQRPGSTLGLNKQSNPDTGESWYSGPGNGVQWAGSTTPTEAQKVGRARASKFIQHEQWGIETDRSIGKTPMAHGGEVVGSHHHPECPHYAEGGEAETLSEVHQNPDLSIDHAVVAHGLMHLLTKTGHSRSEDPARVMNDHLDHVRSGRKSLTHHSQHIFETKKEHEIEAHPKRAQELKAHLDAINQDPSQLLDLGGTLGNALPDHAAALAAKAATVAQHFKAIKPMPHQMDPMAAPIPPSQGKEMAYDRQLEVAETPTLLYQGVKDGTISPEDISTVQSIYPKLFEKMKNQATETLIDAKTRGDELSYKHKIGLGRLLGQPLDYSMTPQAMQAVIHANGPFQGQAETQQKGKRSAPTAQTQKTIQRVDELYQTPIEERLTDRKS